MGNSNSTNIDVKSVVNNATAIAVQQNADFHIQERQDTEFFGDILCSDCTCRIDAGTTVSHVSLTNAANVSSVQTLINQIYSAATQSAGGISPFNSNAANVTDDAESMNLLREDLQQNCHFDVSDEGGNEADCQTGGAIGLAPGDRYRNANGATVVSPSTTATPPGQDGGDNFVSSGGTQVQTACPSGDLLAFYNNISCTDSGTLLIDGSKHFGGSTGFTCVQNAVVKAIQRAENKVTAETKQSSGGSLLIILIIVAVIILFPTLSALGGRLADFIRRSPSEK